MRNNSMMPVKLVNLGMEFQRFDRKQCNIGNIMIMRLV